MEPTEKKIQIDVMDWVRSKPSIKDFVMHVPNGSKRSAHYGAMLKRMGMMKGASDLFIAIPRHGYHGAWIELKSKKGRPSSSQLEFLQRMKAQHYYTAITRGKDETLEAIKWYCLD